MVEVYVLESLVNGSWYKGIALNADKRLKEHNAGKNYFTILYKPWKIIYRERYDNWEAARLREKYFKSAAGRKWLKKKIGDTGEESPPD